VHFAKGKVAQTVLNLAENNPRGNAVHRPWRFCWMRRRLFAGAIFARDHLEWIRKIIRRADASVHEAGIPRMDGCAYYPRPKHE